MKRTRLGKYIMHYCIDKDIKVSLIAKNTGFTQAYLSMVINGGKKPSKRLIEELMKLDDIDRVKIRSCIIGDEIQKVKSIIREAAKKAERGAA